MGCGVCYEGDNTRVMRSKGLGLLGFVDFVRDLLRGLGRCFLNDSDADEGDVHQCRSELSHYFNLGRVPVRFDL